MNTEDDALNRGLQELIARYRSQVEEKDAEIARALHIISFVGGINIG